MIFKLSFIDGRIDWCTAKNQLDLLKSYDAENDLSLQDIDDIVEISDEEAKTIMLTNTEYDEDDKDSDKEISLFDLAVGEDFVIIGSSEWTD